MVDKRHLGSREGAQKDGGSYSRTLDRPYGTAAGSADQPREDLHEKAYRPRPRDRSRRFDGGGNIKSTKDGHMHELTVTFKDADHVTTTWPYYTDGKPGEKAESNLVRKTS
jgi:hypothetical protein